MARSYSGLSVSPSRWYDVRPGTSQLRSTLHATDRVLVDDHRNADAPFHHPIKSRWVLTRARREPTIR